MANTHPPIPPASRSRLTSFRSNPRPANLERIVSARHFDDHYHAYHHESEDEQDEGQDQDTLVDENVGDPGFAGDADQRDPLSKQSDESSEDPEKLEKKESYEDQQVADADQSPSDEKVAEIRGGIPNARDTDLEKGNRLKLEKSQSRRSARSKDPNLVAWEGPDDPANPKNWSMKRKWAATFVVSSFTFISPVSSSMVAPALASVTADLNISAGLGSSLVLSIFVLAYAVGPLFLGPLSETFGRVKVLQCSNLFFLVWNLACGFAQTKGQMYGFRFLAGLGGSAPLAIGGGLISDVWSAEQRGRAISIYSLAPLLGPAIGPIAGGFIAENTTWRWCFWSVTIADAFIQLSGFFFLQETFAPKLLQLKAQKLRKETGNDKLHTEWETPERTLPKVLRTSFIRPFRLLFTQPIIIAISVYQAYLYGLMYLLLATFPLLFTSPDYYNESVGIGGLNYISLGLGFFLGTQITAPINDRIYKKLKKQNNNVGRPEFRIPLCFVGSAFVPVGFFIYGWGTKTHWIVPNIGATIFAAGSIILFQSLQSYIIDSYSRYAASGVAAAVVLRSLAGFGFPLFAPYLYDSLGYPWGNSLLGFIAIGIGIPAPFIFWKYGEKLRSMSKFAAG